MHNCLAPPGFQSGGFGDCVRDQGGNGEEADGSEPGSSRWDTVLVSAVFVFECSAGA